MKHRLPLLLLLLCSGPAIAGTPRYVSGELLVKYRAGADIAKVNQAAKASALQQLPGQRWQRLKLAEGVTVEEALAHYRQQPEVEYAEPNYLVQKAFVPNDVYFPNQWALYDVNSPLAHLDAPSAWDLATGGSGIVIAIVDTGIFYNHPDLNGNMWVNTAELNGAAGVDDDGNGVVDDIYGASFNSGTISGDPKDNDTSEWHGTHVAGIAGALGNNGLGIAGVSWQARLMAVKVMHPQPDGSMGGTVADMVNGIDYAITNGAKVINLSLVLDASVSSTSLTEALQRADTAGRLTVSAAGNNGTSNDTLPTYPAAIRTPNNIAVAALTRNGTLASYTNYGRLSVELAAPGGTCNSFTYEICTDSNAIVSTSGTASGTDYNVYRYLSGTSMAAPHVAGVAALLWNSAPTLSHYQVKARILNGARPLTALATTTISGGTADAYAALSASDSTAAVFQVTPSEAYAGATLTLTGVNFGATAGTVTAGGVELPVTGGWSDTLLTVTVPQELSTNYTRIQVNGAGSGYPVRRLNHLPSASLTIDPVSGTAPLTVTLQASASDMDGSVVRYEWDLGSGTFFIVDGGTTPTLQHTFTNGGSYTLRVRVTDNDGGTAMASAPLEVTGGTSTSSSGGGSDSRCFIATAAYGSPMENEVMALRRFRDRYLLTNWLGTKFVELYYATSPRVADAIRGSERRREVTRLLLRPVVALANWFISDAQAASSTPEPVKAPPAAAVPGEYLVGFVSGTREAQARELISREGGTLREFHEKAGFGLALFPVDEPIDEVLARLRRHEAVRYAEPNQRVRIPAQP